MKKADHLKAVRAIHKQITQISKHLGLKTGIFSGKLTKSSKNDKKFKKKKSKTRVEIDSDDE